MPNKPVNPTKRRALANRKMQRSDFERNVLPAIEAERDAFRRTIAENAQANDPIRRRALEPMRERDAIQRQKFLAGQPRVIQSTTEDRAVMEGELGIERDLNDQLLSIIESNRRKGAE